MGTTQARPLSTTSFPQNAVIAHIYDAQPGWSRVNDFLNAGTKFAGAFHCGIEVSGVEYSFGPCLGVYMQDPKMYPSFRESIFLGVTQYGEDKRKRLIAKKFIVPEWRSDKYRMGSNNCIDFCDSLTVLLGVDRLPRWVGRLPRSFPRLDQMGDTEFSWIRSSASLLDMGEFGNNDEDREPEYLPHLTENTVVMHFENKSWKPKKSEEKKDTHVVLAVQQKRTAAGPGSMDTWQKGCNGMRANQTPLRQRTYRLFGYLINLTVWTCVWV